MRFDLRLLWIAGITVSVVGLIYYFDLRPLTITQQQLEIRIKTLETQTQYLKPSKPQNLLKVSEIPTLLENISKVGLKSDLELRTITPSVPVHKAFYDEVSIEMVAAGEYLAIAKFMKEISRLSPWVLVHSFKLTTDSQKKLNITLLIHLYPNLPYKQTKRLMHDAVSTERNPPQDMHIPQPLEAYPLDVLHMVGSLTKKDARWAIMRVSSNGSIHVVRQGDYLGKNSGRVVAITDTEVRVVVQDRPHSLLLKESKEVK